MLRVTLSHRGRHLTAAELIDRSAACPTCGNMTPRRAVFRIQDEPEISMLSCAACGGCSASRMPTPDCLRDYYAGYHAHREAKVTFSGARRFARHVLRAIGSAHFGRSVRILDFGGGDGSLSRAIADELLKRDPERHVEILLVDYETPEPASGERVHVSHRTSWEDIEGTFDLVLASAVLEHIPELHAVLPRLFGAVDSTGFFYARTAYVLPLARFTRRFDLTYPAHVHDLGPVFWNRVSSTFGWPARLLVSRPSLVATSFRETPFRTAAAHLLKLPAQIEAAFSPTGRVERWWTLVGGWEVLMTNRAPAAK